MKIGNPRSRELIIRYEKQKGVRRGGAWLESSQLATSSFLEREALGNQVLENDAGRGGLGAGPRSYSAKKAPESG